MRYSCPMIALVDYGMGNLRSVEKALQRVGAKVQIVKDAKALSGADRVVMPGVGAFGDCMRNLESQGLIGPLKQFIGSGKPFLGICLGYQALFEKSEEDNRVKGLGIFKGNVVRFPADSGLKVPQIGWNQIVQRSAVGGQQSAFGNCPLLRGVDEGGYVYFVHSYFPDPSDRGLVCAETEYGIRFASMIWRGNLFATQFHPEKSQEVGLKILENFVRL